jgi:hypothetical protein
LCLINGSSASNIYNPERHLIIHPIVDERSIEHDIYFEYDKKEGKKFFQTKPLKMKIFFLANE